MHWPMEWQPPFYHVERAGEGHGPACRSHDVHCRCTLIHVVPSWVGTFSQGSRQEQQRPDTALSAARPDTAGSEEGSLGLITWTSSPSSDCPSLPTSLQSLNLGHNRCSASAKDDSLASARRIMLPELIKFPLAASLPRYPGNILLLTQNCSNLAYISAHAAICLGELTVYSCKHCRSSCN